MFDVVAMGEAVIDFTFAGYSDSQMRLFQQNPGGAPANVLTALSRLGERTALISKVGADMHGMFLKEVLEKEQVNLDGLLIDGNYFTTLAFVDIDKDGERRFSFARKPGADNMLRKEEVRKDLIEQAEIFHFGSVSLTGNPSRDAVIEAVRTAKAAGCTISFDPNYRKMAWTSEEKAAREIRSVLEYVDIVKVSDEEMEVVTGKKDKRSAGKYLLDQGIKAVFITLGAEGAYIMTKEGEAYEPALKCRVIDKNGAGDAFWGGVLHCISSGGKRVGNYKIEELSSFAAFGNQVASLSIGRSGAIPSLPTKEEMENVFKK
ncbi:MAG: carbohydrate kinase [Lachnospiraceae bacterium]|jgi:fructokinase|nr:carbohydrate kinase [Lachnospiraceae bacterium]